MSHVCCDTENDDLCSKSMIKQWIPTVANRGSILNHNTKDRTYTGKIKTDVNISYTSHKSSSLLCLSARPLPSRTCHDNAVAKTSAPTSVLKQLRSLVGRAEGWKLANVHHVDRQLSLGFKFCRFLGKCVLMQITDNTTSRLNSLV